MLITIRLVAAACFLAIAVRQDSASAYPSPGAHKKKLVIYTPIKYKVIHHHKVEKVPIVVKKHVHRHYNQHEAKVESHSGVKHYDHFHYTFENSGHDDHHDSDDGYESQDDHGYHEDHEEHDQGDEHKGEHDYEESQDDHEDDGDHQGFQGFIGYHGHHSGGSYKSLGHGGGGHDDDDDDDDYSGHQEHGGYGSHQSSGGSYKFVSGGSSDHDDENHSDVSEYIGHYDHESSGGSYKSGSGHGGYAGYHSHQSSGSTYKFFGGGSSGHGTKQFVGYHSHQPSGGSYKTISHDQGSNHENYSPGLYKYIQFQDNDDSYKSSYKGLSGGTGGGGQKGNYYLYPPNYDWSHDVSFGKENSYKIHENPDEYGSSHDSGYEYENYEYK